MPGRAERVAGLPVSLPPRPVVLAGREELLAELDARLAGALGGGPRVVSLHGLGGAGKTSVAVEYAHRHLAEVGLAWQFPAEDPALLLAEFARLAAQLGAREVVDPRDPVASVHGVLAAFPNEWLLVFDNAAGQEALHRLLPPAGRGRVLITSQSAVWPTGQAVEVQVLGTAVAAGFLVNRTGDLDMRAATELAEELGGLPLALEQAAAYIQVTGITLSAYLALFHKRRADLLARGQPARYGGTVATTWALAFTQLQDSDPGAAGLLRLLAFCAPEAIPLRLLRQPHPGLAGQLSPQVARVIVPLLEDELAAGDAVAALRRYSLARPAGDGLVSVHRLVQGVTADQIPQELCDAWRQAAAAVIEAAIPADPLQSATWPVFATLLPHAQAALSASHEGMGRIADYLWHSGSYAAARDLYRAMVQERGRDLGAEHPQTLAARANAAHLTGKAGDAAGARDQFTALLSVYERVSGPNHPDTLTTRAKIARFTGEAGDAARARDQFAALLPVYERVLGADHRHTLAIVRADLARFTGEAGDAAGARDQYAALLPVAERVFGPDDSETLSDRANMARFTGQAGDAAGARDQFAALLPISERLQGAEHPHTLLTRARLARFTGEAGDAAGARDQYTALLPIMEQVLGAEHPDTLTTRAHLARWTGNAEDAAGARDQFAMLLPLRERVLGAEHPDTLTTRAGLAYWTGQAGDAAEARDQYAALLPLHKRVLGAEHPDTLTTQHGLAAWTGQAGDAVRARDQCAMLLPLQERILGPEHPNTLTTRASLAHWTGEAGDPAAARDQYAAVLPLRERVLGPKHPATLATRTSLASWTKRSGS
jgi:Tetratricopeptide repeat